MTEYDHGLIRYRGHTITEEFVGIDVPHEYRLRQMDANGVSTRRLLGLFETIEDAKTWVDEELDDPQPEGNYWHTPSA